MKILFSFLAGILIFLTLSTRASTIEPLVEEDSTGWLRMNIDKDNQASGGEDMIVISNVASPDTTGDGEFVIKTLDSAGIAFEATTDSEGKL